MPTNHDPCQASAAEPLVLLPVRLETRFETSGKESSLKVRIYPDEVHVDDLARGLTEEEETAGQAYWQAVWFEPPAELAWEQLLKSVGPERAEWVAHALTPTNLAERGSAAPRFPDVARPGPGNVVARGLPDAFVVIAIQDNQVSSKVGEPIEPELPMNPLPLDEEEPKTVAGSLAVPSGSEWLVDYTAAEKVGMAVTVPLAGGRAPVQRVLALGARGSSSPAAGAGELEDLLRGHRFGAGLELLAQGTPTNNADGARSPYRSRREPQPPLPAAPSTSEDSDAAATAAALGIDPTFLAGLVGDGSGEQLIAQQVNTALWGPGWGSYLDQLKDRKVFGLDDHQVESARRLFGNHVRGRGPAATIRVGAQPYGVLPVSDLSAWKPQVGETTAGIVEVVKLLLPRWLRAADLNVPLIRTGDPEVDKTALEVLGSSPVMLGLRVRPVVNKEKAELAPVIGVSSDPFEAERDLIATAYSTLLGEDSRKAMIGSLDAPNRPLPLPLVSARDPEFIAGLLREPSEELAIDSVLQALLALAWKETDYSAARAAPATVVPDLIDLVELDPRLKEVTVALSARAGEAGAEELHGVVSELQDVGIEVGGPSRLLDFQPAAIIPTSLGEVALASPSTDKSRLLAGEALSWWLREMAYKAEVREAMEALLHTDLEARKLAVAEALDCSSHRLDAWATAIVAERRALQLSGKGDGAAARGLTLGAYGVVEDLVPDDEDADGSRLDEWIQAPSPGHAVAAGILRSAHLSHLPTDEKGGPFAIDLSSVRVQAATHLLEGVRQGQQLGAIVGYQIERGLAEIGQARLQLSLRTIAPLVARRLSDADGADPTATREAVAANNVVDGVLLLELHPPGDEALRSKLKDPPQNSYLGKDDWLPLDDKQWEEVTKVMEAAAEALDTVADVMLSESVMQFANGNAQRAAAAMDAMSTGASPDESVDVLDTREASERLDHRLLVVVGSDPPASGWNENRPRALAEPRLESWAATRLGDPAEIVVAELAGGERFTLDEAGMAALDLVFAADRARLERALRIAIPGLGGAELASQRDSSWPQGQRALGQVLTLAAGLRGLVAGATPLLPLDLARSSEEAAREMGPALPELTARVTDLVGSFTQATKKLRETVAALPKDGIVEDAGEVAVPTHAAYDLDRFGIPLEPDPTHLLDLSWVRFAAEEAAARRKIAKARLKHLKQLAADTRPDLVLEAAQEVAAAVLGEGFPLLPLLHPLPDPAPPKPPLRDAFVEALEQPAFAAPAASELRRVLRDHATVRRQASRLSESLLVGDALGLPRRLEVVQIGGRDENGDPAAGTEHWLAGPLPPEGPWPQEPVAHLVLDRVGEIEAKGNFAGLVIDAWVEDLPGQPDPKADPEEPRPNRARTGLAVRSNSASARPPQALLCAISPDGEDWTTAKLQATIEQTLKLARARMVTLERLAGEGLALPALYTRSSSLQGEEYLDFVKLRPEGVDFIQVPFVKEDQ